MTITLTMDDRRLATIHEVKQFTEGAATVEFCGASRREKYAWIEQTLSRFQYGKRRKKERFVLKQFIRTTTGYSDIQTKRLNDSYLTPYEKFISLPVAKNYLKPGITTSDLETIANRLSDTDYAIMMQKQKAEVFKNLSR